MKIATPIVLVVALASLVGCGGSDTETAKADETVSDLGQSVAGDGDGDGDGELQGSSELDTLGFALDSVLSGADGYEVDGDTLTLSMSGSSEETSSACTIAMTAGAGVMSTPFTLVLAYADGDVTCEK